MLRYAVFLIFIVFGFILSRHRHLYPIVAVVYLIALFYYTFLSRMELAATTEAVVANSTPVVQHWWVNAAYEIFRMKTSSYHEAFILNIMLFVPMGYLLPTIRTNHKGEQESTANGWGMHWWSSVLICSAASMCIEILQQLTGFGMFDWNDWIANSIGGCVGVVILIAYQKITKAALNRASARSGLVFKYQRHMNE